MKILMVSVPKKILERKLTPNNVIISGIGPLLHRNISVFIFILYHFICTQFVSNFFNHFWEHNCDNCFYSTVINMQHVV